MKMKQFCNLLNVSNVTVMNWQKAGYIPDRRDKNGYRIFNNADVAKIVKLRRNIGKIYPKNIIQPKGKYEKNKNQS